MRRFDCISLILFILFLIFSRAGFAAENRIIPGEFRIEPSTLLCAGFEWAVTGDDNRNARVEVKFREKGAKKWHAALPLMRQNGERTWYERVELDFTAPNLFAGSIFNLMPGTTYECHFSLADPDGVTGPTEQTVFVETRRVPKAAEGGRVRHVYPENFKGIKEAPTYPDLLSAYYGYGQGYWGGAQVQPGDVILVHAGIYRADYHHYSSDLNLDFYGTYVLTKNGTPDRPIVIRAAGDGEVVFDGDGTHRLFDVTHADYTFFEGLTICNADIAIFAGLRHATGCDGLVVRDCLLENVGVGIQAQYVGSKNFYIADNIILGRDGRRRVHGWTGDWLEYGLPAQVRSFIGVDINGQGHVVCHNFVAYFHDGIDVTQQGPPESDDPTMKAASIDFYNNDIFLMADDFFEADCGVHNIRIFQNRCLNAAHAGISAQPIYGGPAYFIRNILYNIPSGGTLKFNMNPSGILMYHNTFCGEWAWGAAHSNTQVRNNLFLGTDFPERPVLSTRFYTAYSSLDYNGYRLNRNSENQFIFQAPPDSVLQDYEFKFSTMQSFKTLEAFQQTGQEIHGILVDYDALVNVPKPNPDRPGEVYRGTDFDFRLKPGSRPVDAGCRLPNINAEFQGKAPDLGALEAGNPLPVFGPRTEIRQKLQLP